MTKESVSSHAHFDKEQKGFLLKNAALDFAYEVPNVE